MSNDPEQILRASMQDFGDDRSSSRSARSSRESLCSPTRQSKYDSPQHCSGSRSHNWESLMGISDHHDRSAYKKGGSIRAVAQKLKRMGRGGDTDVVHVNEKEKRVLKAMGGRGTINPKTGLREYMITKLRKTHHCTKHESYNHECNDCNKIQEEAQNDFNAQEIQDEINNEQEFDGQNQNNYNNYYNQDQNNYDDQDGYYSEESPENKIMLPSKKVEKQQEKGLHKRNQNKNKNKYQNEWRAIVDSKGNVNPKSFHRGLDVNDIYNLRAAMKNRDPNRAPESVISTVNGVNHIKDNSDWSEDELKQTNQKLEPHGHVGKTEINTPYISLVGNIDGDDDREVIKSRKGRTKNNTEYKTDAKSKKEYIENKAQAFSRDNDNIYDEKKRAQNQYERHREYVAQYKYGLKPVTKEGMNTKGFNDKLLEKNYISDHKKSYPTHVYKGKNDYIVQSIPSANDKKIDSGKVQSTNKSYTTKNMQSNPYAKSGYSININQPEGSKIFNLTKEEHFNKLSPYIYKYGALKDGHSVLKISKPSDQIKLKDINYYTKNKPVTEDYYNKNKKKQHANTSLAKIYNENTHQPEYMKRSIGKEYRGNYHFEGLSPNSNDSRGRLSSVSSWASESPESLPQRGNENAVNNRGDRSWRYDLDEKTDSTDNPTETQLKRKGKDIKSKTSKKNREEVITPDGHTQYIDNQTHPDNFIDRGGYNLEESFDMLNPHSYNPAEGFLTADGYNREFGHDPAAGYDINYGTSRVPGDSSNLSPQVSGFPNERSSSGYNFLNNKKPFSNNKR